MASWKKAEGNDGGLVVYPREYMAEPFFVVYISDENVQDMFSMFTDDTKTGVILDNEAGYQTLKKEFDQLGK